MTVQDAIDNAKMVCDDQFDDPVKFVWIRNLDLQIYNSIINTHNEDMEVPEEYSSDTVIIMPAPYNEAYGFYIQAQSCLANAEIDEYNNAMSMCQSLIADFRNFWNSKYPSKTTAEGKNKMILW